MASAPFGHNLSYWKSARFRCDNKSHAGARVVSVPLPRDPLTGKWIRARYVAELHVSRESYAEWEIIGPPEIRSVADDPFSLQASHVARGR